eukprot:CAMPEP_0203762952 /NCGR_PEP_ID=MMETSP0098-20131031/15713_1 /ASSEMBLY_ACC=CAM_ASM_000208 /TAXON_ID=96639 /ORGANISM=" , Strain NY0313808BC1" /LENGTH=285 /DNA_ID=CAMNT_0050657553 /DNA_START=184 /DNA_END=1041 /DNA_ORIENTATION=-
MPNKENKCPQGPHMETVRDACKDNLIKQFFESVDPELEWQSHWEATRDVKSCRQKDDGDPCCSLRGNGTAKICQEQITLHGKPRYYITCKPGKAWRNVELTGYVRVDEMPQSISRSTGVAIGTRSNHDSNDIYPCDAHGYYIKYWAGTQEIGIQKEFYHDAKRVIYSCSKRAKRKLELPSGSFLGLKYIVRDNKDGCSVNLEVYIDLTEGLNGGTWEKVLSFKDENWKATNFDSDERFPCTYPYKPQGVPNHCYPVLRPGRATFLRSDVEKCTWKWVSIREIDHL